MPYPEKYKTIDLEPVGAPELTVKWLRVAYMGYNDMQAHFDKVGEEEDARMHIVNNMRLITEWDMPSLVDGSLLPLPSAGMEEMTRALTEIPTQFINFIVEMLTSDIAEATNFDSNLVKKVS